MKSHLKKILVITNVLTLGLLIWCWWYSHTCCPARPPYTHGDSIAFNVLRSTAIEGGCVQDPDLGSFEFNGADAIKLVSNYTKDHWEDINISNNNTNTDPSLMEMKDSRSIWFSLSRLKGFIQAIEANATINMTSPCCDTLGIRIYLAEYDKQLIQKFNESSNQQFNPGFTYLNKTTVVMIPTYRMNDGKDHDFNPLNPVVCNLVDTSGAMWTGPIMALMMNHGGIIPPPFPSIHASDPNGSSNFIYKNSGADFMVFGVDAPYNNSVPSSPNPYINQTSIPTPAGNWLDR